MRSWDTALGAHGLVPAQALLVPHDFVDRRQYLHARRTLTRLLELGTVPIINENDAIASDETRYGDNDRIAALVAHNIAAGVLVLLTDLDGLYTADPRVAADAAARRRGSAATTRCCRSAPVAAAAGGGAAGMASQAGGGPHRVVVGRAHGHRQRGAAGVLAGAIADEPVGTTFEAHRRKLSARKLWIAFAVPRRRHGDGRRRRPPGARRAPDEPAAGRRRRRRRAASARATPSTSPAPTASPSPAGWCSSRPPSCAASPAATRATCPPGMAHEVIHRDDLVLLPG